MRKQVIIINGHPGSGKTTVSKIIAEQEKVMIRSSIDFVKEIAVKFFGWDGLKREEDRKFLSNMKQFLNEYTDLIERDLKRAYDNFMKSDSRFLLIDIREADEIEKYKKMFDAITVFIDNPRAKKITTNSSDKQIEETVYDYTIKNHHCLGSLRIEVNRFIKEIELNNFKAKLFLRKGETDQFIDYVSSVKQALSIMSEWLKEQRIEHLYTRRWMNEENEIILDFGSHHTFFVIKNQRGLFL
jgi:adenylate kinase family enzyme